MDCQSFFHRSGYREDIQQQKADFDALLAERDNHAAIQSRLALELITRRPTTKTVLEIGHGTGYFLKALGNYGLDAEGFDVNPFCHEFATQHLKVRSHVGLLPDEWPMRYDLIAAIQVFEHLERPRLLFSQLMTLLNSDGAIYLSVPFVERNQWKFLQTADQVRPHDPRDPFSDNDVHVTHFSIEGMKRMGLSFGARSADYFVSKDTFYQSPGSYHGVLFHF